MIRGTVLTAVAVASLGLVAWTALFPDSADGVITTAGLVTGLASLLLALADFFREDPAAPDPAALADDLALRLREQWLEEAQARQLRDPRVLPLTWTTTARDVADVPRSAHSRVLRMRLDGRLDGRFDEVTARLAADWGRLPEHRLVAIGEPGSGKTVLAILLTLGLLGVRAPGGPLPVLLPVSSWDPVRERLDDWIVRTLAQPYYNGRTEIPRTLLTHGLLLPVLDGLDEIPESARRSAIRGINHAIGGERPVVVTCRAAEYEELIRGGAPTLRRAAVVEILPVPTGDVIGYLGEARWPEGTDWAGVFARLRTDPDGPLATALSTPLMVTSARLVYQRGGGDPAELLDEGRFDSAHAVEDHLINGLVDAAYAPDPEVAEGAPRERWSAERARGYLAFLATYLHDHRERDLAWWLMSGRLLSPWAGPVTGLAIAAALVLVAVAWMAATRSIQPEAWGPAGVLVWLIGCVFALFNSLIWYVHEARPPGRLAWSVRGSAGRLLRGFRAGVAVALVCTSPLIVAITVLRVFAERGDRSSPRTVELCAEAVLICVALAVVVGLALAAHNWLDAPPSRATQVSPEKSLAQDRRSAVVSATAAGLVVAVTGPAGWVAGVVAGDVLLGLLTDWTGWPGHPDIGALAENRRDAAFALFDGWDTVIGIAMLLPGVFFALLTLMGRAWPRFVVVRCHLAARGLLPWRLMAFLADARRRELLRQAGGVYQFRHIRLQETLAGEQAYTSETAEARARRAAVRRRTVLAAGVGVAAVGTAWALSGRRDQSTARLAVEGRGRVVAVAMRPRHGREVAYVVEDGSVWRWTGRSADRKPTLLRTALGGAANVMAPAAFTRDGRFLLLARSVADEGMVEIVDIAAGSSRHLTYGGGSDAAGGLLSVRSGLLAWTDTSKLAVWKLSGAGAATLLAHHTVEGDGATGMGFLADGRLVVETDGRSWQCLPPRFDELDRGLLPRSRLWDVQGDDSPDTVEYGTSLAVSPADNSFALFGPKGAEVWHARGPRWFVSPLDLGTPSAGAFHPSGRLLATADLYDTDVRLWYTDDIRRGPRRIGHNGPVFALDFSDDGHWLATASADGTVRIWDVRGTV